MRLHGPWGHFENQQHTETRHPRDSELICAIDAAGLAAEAPIGRGHVPGDEELLAGIRQVEKLHEISGKYLSTREVRDELEGMGFIVGKKRVARFRGPAAPSITTARSAPGKENNGGVSGGRSVARASKDPLGRISEWMGIQVVINRQDRKALRKTTGHTLVRTIGQGASQVICGVSDSDISTLFSSLPPGLVSLSVSFRGFQWKSLAKPFSPTSPTIQEPFKQGSALPPEILCRGEVMCERHLD